MRTLRVLVAAVLAIAAFTSTPRLPRADAEVAPSEGRVFAPRPVPEPRYDIAPPSPTEQNITIAAGDGTRLYIEWWLPTQLEDGPAPPPRLPVIAILSPYLRQGTPGERDTMEMVVGQGYAYAAFHVRGTGLSGDARSSSRPTRSTTRLAPSSGSARTRRSPTAGSAPPGCPIRASPRSRSPDVVTRRR